MNRILLLFLLSISILSCSGYRQNNCFKAGIYTKSGSSDSFIFNSDNTYHILTNPSAINGFMGFDTISYGNWEIENSFLVLNSSKKIPNEYLSMDVEESVSNSKDSLYIFITNEYKGLHKSGKESIDLIFEPYFFYKLNLFGNVINEDLKHNNNIKLPLSRQDNIRSLNLEIIPNLDLYPISISYNRLYTRAYKIQNQENNTFKVTIKNFTFKNFTYKRFRDEYLKINNCEVLKWDGEIFRRVDD